MTNQWMEIKLKELEKRVKVLEQDSILDKIRSEIEQLPSVSTEKTGRWILTDKEEEIYCHVAICSVCGKESINEGVDDYCSWCGAKMEVKE